MSPPPTFTRFAILGSGQVARSILTALLSLPFPTTPESITILTRHAPTSPPLPTSPIIKLALISSYSNTSDEITNILSTERSEVVIDATRVAEAGFHKTLVDAARKAEGVKLFVPSEFGNVTDEREGRDEGDFKGAVRAYLRGVGLPFVAIFCNCFISAVPWLVQSDQGKFYILGEGNTPASYTALPDVARFLAHILTTLPLHPTTSPSNSDRLAPPTSLSNSSFRLQSSRLTLLQLHALPSFSHLPLVHLPLSSSIPPSAPGKEDEEGTAFATLVQWWTEGGRCSTGWDWEAGKDREGWAGSGNGVVGTEGWGWERVEDVYGKEGTGV